MPVNIAGTLKPSGPAQLINQAARSAFSLKVGEDAVFTATVRVQREENLMTFKEARATLFVLSRSDGWDTVLQSIRVAGIGLLPTDTLVLKGTVHGPALEITDRIDGLQIENSEEADYRAVWSKDADWMISVDDQTSDLTLKRKPDGTMQFIVTAHEINISYRPCVSKYISQ